MESVLIKQLFIGLIENRDALRKALLTSAHPTDSEHIVLVFL